MILVGDWAPSETKVILPSLGNSTVLANLEGPILPCASEYNAADKAGPHLFASTLPETNNPFIFSLANNHIMDYGVRGLEATQVQLRQRNFSWCGAGQNIHTARKPIIIDDEGVRLGIIACCEAQFGSSRLDSPGVAEFGPWIYAAIDELSQTVDAIIISVHAAVEDSPWPSPYIRELYHSYIDAGASVIHGHHAHVPQGYEAYKDGVIFYGMGNFAVDPNKWQSHPNALWSLAAEVDFSVKPLYWHPLTFEIRYRAGSEIITVEESTDEEQRDHKHYLEICNRPFDNPELFAALWQETALRAYYHHGASYMRFLPQSKVERRMQAKMGSTLLKNAILNKDMRVSFPNHYDYMLWYHMIACESHRQMLATALGLLGGEIKDLRTEETRILADEMMPWSRGMVVA